MIGAGMVHVEFTQNIQAHVACPPCEVEGDTVSEVLDAVFARYQGLRGYVLDEHGAVRNHMVVFVNGVPVRDREGLSDTLADGAEVCVMQALSGG